MKIKGWDLKFFDSGEWQVCDERLKDLEKINRPIGLQGYNPRRHDLFRSLRTLPSGEVRCCIVGQDPYPGLKFSTGIAFSIPNTIQQSEWPPTFITFIKEYCKDLGHPMPSSGDLSKWNSPEGGVLLWNAVPSCRTGTSLSHDWDEWSYLTREVINTLTKKGIVFALLGQVARRYSYLINDTNNHLITLSHPSPRGSMASKTPFIGSRLFSTINDRLNDLALPTIDWKLP